MFADDIKIFTKIDSLSDVRGLQRDIDIICSYLTNNNLQLSTDKCKVMTYTRKVKAILSGYYLSGNVVGRCNTIKDLL